MNAELKGNTQNCPVCNGLGRIVDGTFEFRDNVIKIIKAPEFTRDLLDDLIKLSEGRATGKIGDEKYVEQVKLIYPALGALAEHILSRSKNPKLLICVIIAAIAYNTTFDLNRFIDQSASLVQYLLSPEQQQDPGADRDNEDEGPNVFDL